MCTNYSFRKIHALTHESIPPTLRYQILGATTTTTTTATIATTAVLWSVPMVTATTTMDLSLAVWGCPLPTHVHSDPRINTATSTEMASHPLLPRRLVTSRHLSTLFDRFQTSLCHQECWPSVFIFRTHLSLLTNVEDLRFKMVSVCSNSSSMKCSCDPNLVTSWPVGCPSGE